MTQKIFLITGEHSGDVLGSGLMKALLEQAGEDNIEFSGIGGPLMEQHGFESLLPMDELCVMGLWEVIAHLPRLLKLIDAVVYEIEKFQPDVVVTIDLPDFNFQVAARLKKSGSKARLVHYVAPTVWAWRPGRAKKVARFLDGLICLYPMEPPFFTKHGLKAEFVGHPLIEHEPGDADGKSFRERFGIPVDAPVLGLFFGSRVSELNTHSAILMKMADVVKEHYEDLNVIVPTLPNLEYEMKQLMVGAKYPAFVLINPDEKWDEFAACDVALAVSGTVGLELAYMGVPHAIAYKMHPVSWLLVKLLVKTKYAHLANILLNEPVIPEYLQGKCNVVHITKGLLTLFKDENQRTTQTSKTGRLREILTATPGKSPSASAADFVLRIAKEPAKILQKKSAKPAGKPKAIAPTKKPAAKMGSKIPAKKALGNKAEAKKPEEKKEA